MPNERVLVTGGSGFIAGHCILQLLASRYEVRATVRSLGNRDELTAMLERAGAVHVDNLSFLEADLTDDAGWKHAASEID